MPEKKPDLYLAQALALRESLLKEMAPEPLHDFRTLLRRLETVLRLQKKLLNPEEAKRALGGLKALRRSANPLRDLDVLAGYFPGQKLPAPLAVKRQQLAGKMWETMTFPGTLRLLLALRDLLRQMEEEVLSKPGQKSIRSAFNKETNRLMTELRDYRKKGPQPKLLHQVRIHSKRLRYSLEMFKSLRSKGWRKLRDYAEECQETLGQHRDNQLAQKFIRARDELSKLKIQEKNLSQESHEAVQKLDRQLKHRSLD